MGQASMQTPQFGQENTSTLAKPRRAFLMHRPAFLIGMSIISAGICI